MVISFFQVSEDTANARLEYPSFFNQDTIDYSDTDQLEVVYFKVSGLSGTGIDQQVDPSITKLEHNGICQSRVPQIGTFYLSNLKLTYRKQIPCLPE